MANASGGLLLVRRNVPVKAHGWDTGMAIYMNELNVSWRESGCPPDSGPNTSTGRSGPYGHEHDRAVVKALQTLSASAASALAGEGSASAGTADVSVCSNLNADCYQDRDTFALLEHAGVGLQGGAGVSNADKGLCSWPGQLVACLRSRGGFNH